MEKTEGKYLKHNLIERVLHWIYVSAVVLLILSGLQIHFAGFDIFGPMNNARYVHFIAMYFFIFTVVAEAYQFFALGTYKVSMFRPEDINGLIPMMKYYLLATSKEPEFEKYNPLQKIAYGVVTSLMTFIVIITGLTLYWPVTFVFVAKFFGGLGYVRLFHYLFSWFYIVFLMIHVYLVFSEDVRKSFVPMITGYAPKEEKH